jgi:hypothetical protein
MASSTVYFASDGDFEDRDHLDALLLGAGTTRQRRIGGNQAYRDDPVRRKKCIALHCIACVTLLLSWNESSSHSFRFYRRLLHLDPFRHHSRLQRTTCLCTSDATTRVSHARGGQDVPRTLWSNKRVPMAYIIEMTLMIPAGRVERELQTNMAFG